MADTEQHLDSKKMFFNIPQQRADVSLTQFAEQADLTLIFKFKTVKEKTANKLEGRYSVNVAINLLLDGTELQPVFSDQGLLMSVSDEKSEPEGDEMNLRKKTGLVAFIAALFSVGAGAQEAGDTDGAEQVLSEIVVTGSHIRQASGFQSRSELLVVSREQMVAGGYTTLKDIVMNSPVNTGSLYMDPTGDQTGTSQFNIRGLGVGSTLTLVNGRRAGIAAVSNSTGANFLDINTLPLVMVQRVDLLVDGSSAIYGSDAVAGVANIITRKGFEGVELSGGYYDASNESWSIGIATGLKTDSGIFNLYGSHYEQTKNERKDFDWAVDRLNGGVVSYFHSRDPAVLTDGFVNSSTGSPGTYTQAVVDPVTGVISPSGGGPVADPDCVAAGGVLDGTLCRFNFMDQRSTLPSEDRTQLFAEMELDISSRLAMFAEIGFSRNITERTYGPQFFANGLVDNNRPFVPGDHAFNFFIAAPTIADPFALVYRGPDANGVWSGTDEQDWASGLLQGADLVCQCRPLGNEYNAERSLYPDYRVQIDYSRYMFGFEYALPKKWIADVSYQYSTYNYDVTAPYEYKADLFNAFLLDGTWNPFGTRISQPGLVSPKDGTSISENGLDLIDQIVGTLHRSRRTTQETVDLTVSGGVGELPGGKIGVAVGIQLREDTLVVTPDTARAGANGNDNLFASSLSGTQDVWATFGEVLLPVTDNWEVQLAARYEDFGDDVNTTDPKLSTRWQATEWLALRGSYGSSFQTPSLRQNGETISNAFVEDSCSPGAPSINILTIQTGSDDLKPQSADNYSVGFVLQPADAVQVSLDYWDYDYTDLISPGASPQAIVNADCADGVHDDPNIIRGGEGQIIRVLSNSLNIGSVRTSGVDFVLNYSSDLSNFGTLDLRMMFSYMDRFDVKNSPTGPTIDAKGSRNSSNNASDFGPTPELRGNASLGWRRGNHAATVTVRYIDSYEEDNDGGQVEDFTTLDLQYSFVLDALIGESTVLTVGVNNAADRDPPNIGDGNRPGFDNFTHDPRGREIYAQFTHRF